MPNNLLSRAVGSPDPSLNDVMPSFIPSPDGPTRLGMQASWIAFGFPLPDGLGVHQQDNDTFWVWNAESLAWVQIAMSSTGLPYREITIDGGTIVYGATNILVMSDSTQTITGLLTQAYTMKIFNSQPFNATVICPLGMTFSDGDTQKILGQGSVLNLSYFSGTIINVDSFTSGVPS